MSAYQDYSHANFKLLFTGTTGTGKTTLALRMLKAWIAAGKYDYIFIFDPERQWAQRLGAPTADRLDYAVAALDQSGGVCFDPSLLFQGNNHAAFEWFCEWFWTFIGAVPGTKLIIADDFPDYMPVSNARYLAHPMSKIMGAGRRRGADVLALCRLVTEASPLFRGNFSEYFAFAQGDETCAENVAKFGFSLEEVKHLKPGQYLHLTKATGEIQRGKINLPKKR